MTQGSKGKERRPASGALIATRAVTLLIAAVMLNISLHGQQQLAKLGLAAVTTGTLLLTPDAFGAFLREKELRWPSQTHRERLGRGYQLVMLVIGIAALVGIIIGVVLQAESGELSEESRLFYLGGLAALTIVLVFDLVPLWLIKSAKDIASGSEGLPKGLREWFKSLPMRFRLAFGYAEQEGWPAALGVTIFLLGVALQFLSIPGS